MDDDNCAISSQVIATQMFNANNMAHTQENAEFLATPIARTKSALNDAFRLLAYEYATPHDPLEDQSLVINTRVEIVSALVSFVPKVATSDWLDVSPCVVTHHAIVHVKRELAKFHDYNTEHYVEKMKRATEVRRALNEKIVAANPSKDFTPMNRNVTCPKCRSHAYVHLSDQQTRKADEPSTWLYECGNTEAHGKIAPFNDVAATLD